MAEGDLEARLVGQPLELELPEPEPGAVAQGRVAALEGWPAGALPLNPAAADDLAGPHIGEPARDESCGRGRSPAHRRQPAPTDGQCLRPRQEPAGPPVDQRGHTTPNRPLADAVYVSSGRGFHREHFLRP